MPTISSVHLKFPLLLLLTLALLGGFSAGQRAYGHGAGGDIALFSTNGQVDIGFAILDDDDEDQLVFDPHENVFSLVLLPQNPNPVVPWQFGSSEPGFDANEETLPPEADIAYNLLELQYWDGQSSEVLFTSATGINSGVAPTGKSDAEGGFHSHPLFGVADPNGTAAEGVYVGKLTVSVEGLTDSAPYYMVSLVTDAVTGLGTVAEQEAAAEEIGEMAKLYSEDPLNNPAPTYGGSDFTFFANAISQVRAEAVPEPSSLALAGILHVGTGSVRRRRS
ncbi:PEP-CTERM sorting domain-containing protein [Adhaeretor mobilis]|uniref:Uncharacterized protein n=1 Tax=Adhaeretor mobilis TaxID=1930276 RepID=A0A517MQC9_9BACT|nr:PEP-CTERM sorting domain-containing protein [Adhaeretor mobilis]QDS97090.1 hypothetical protein HG15A2_03500 [Adhaeretor mobilis]